MEQLIPNLNNSICLLYSNLHEILTLINIKKIMKSKIGSVFFELIVVIILAGCVKSPEEKFWNDALSINSVEAFSGYKSQFPNGKYIIQADSLIQKIVWSNALETNTVESIEEYYKKYPKGFYIRQADSIYEIILWECAIKTQNMSYYIKFKNKFPNSVNYAKAIDHVKKYLIKDNSVYGLSVGMNFPYPKLKYYDVKIEEFVFYEGDTYIDYIFNFVEKNDTILQFFKRDNKVGVISILSKKIKTARNIGVGSSLSEIQDAYPDMLLVKTHCLITGEGEVPYVLMPENKYIVLEVDRYIEGDEYTELNINKNLDAKIVKIHIFKDKSDYYTITNSIDVNKKEEARQKEEANRKTETYSSSPKNSISLPSWLSNSTWKVRDSNGQFLLGVRFVDNDFLDFQMYGFETERCEYTIQPNAGFLIFKYYGKNMELWYDNSNRTLETKTGVRFQHGN